MTKTTNNNHKNRQPKTIIHNAVKGVISEAEYTVLSTILSDKLTNHVSNYDEYKGLVSSGGDELSLLLIDYIDEISEDYEIEINYHKLYMLLYNVPSRYKTCKHCGSVLIAMDVYNRQKYCQSREPYSKKSIYYSPCRVAKETEKKRIQRAKGKDRA